MNEENGAVAPAPIQAELTAKDILIIEGCIRRCRHAGPYGNYNIQEPHYGYWEPIANHMEKIILSDLSSIEDKIREITKQIRGAGAKPQPEGIHEAFGYM